MLVDAFVVHHLQNQLNLIYILYELAFQSLAVLVFALDIVDILACDSTIDFSEQTVREVMHGCFFSSVLLMLCDFIHRCDISNNRHGHIVNESSLRLVWDIDLRG